MNKGLERKGNLLGIIGALRCGGAMSQSRLKDCCGLRASTVSYLVRDLKACGLVKDLGRALGNGKAGKPGSIVALNNDLASFLGIYAEDDRLDALVVGIDEATLDERHVRFEEFRVEEAIFSTIRQTLERYPNIRGVGVAIKAMVLDDGTIRSGRRHDAAGGESFWHFSGLRERLGDAFPQMLIAVENDANCAAVRFHYQNRRETQNLIVCLLNRDPFGIGCGLLVNGCLFRGASGAAGEFYDGDKRLRGLAESLFGGEDFIERFVPAILPRVMDAVCLLDPERVVLAGSFFDGLGEAGRMAVEKAFKASPAPVSVMGGIRELSPAKGAALLVTDDYIAAFIEEVKKR